MNTTGKNRASFLLWVAISTTVVIAVVWNCLEFQNLRVHQLALVDKRNIDKQEKAKADQIQVWQTDDYLKIGQLSDDQETVLAMYDYVQVPDDFFVVFPDQVCWLIRKVTSQSFRLILYVPEGNHNLNVHVGQHFFNVVNGQPNIDFAEIGDNKLSLEGGRTHEISVTLNCKDEKYSEIQIKLAGHENIEILIDGTTTGGLGYNSTKPESEYENWQRSNRNNLNVFFERQRNRRRWQLSKLPNQFSMNFDSGDTMWEKKDMALKTETLELAENSFGFINNFDGRSGSLNITLELESDGPPRSRPTNPKLHTAMLGNALDIRKTGPLEYLKYDERGWYYLEIPGVPVD